MRRRGHTLIELMTVLAVAALLAGLAAPTFAALREWWALKTATSGLLTALARTRVAALSEGRDVALCPATAAYDCTTGTGSAWAVFRPGEPALAPLLRGRLPQGVRLTATRALAVHHAWPRAAATVTLTLCATPRRERSRRIVVSQAGRPRVEDGGRC